MKLSRPNAASKIFMAICIRYSMIDDWMLKVADAHSAPQLI